ncbi:MAG: hypothetical protein ACOCQN_04615, partial [Halanaerobiaceae bacterium]
MFKIQKKLIVSIIIVLLFVIMISDLRINGIDVFEDYFRQMETDSIRNIHFGEGSLNYSGQRIEETKTDTVNLGPEVSGLSINNRAGSIKVKGEKREDISLEYKVIVFTEKKEIGEEIIDSIIVAKRTVEDRLIMELKGGDSSNLPEGINGVIIEYRLRVPDHLFLDLENRYGELNVSDINENIRLGNYYDRMSVRNIYGDAEIFGRYGATSINNIQGSLDLDTRYNSVNVDTVEKNINLTADYGQAKMVNVGGPADIEYSYGSLEFNDIRGEIRLDSKYTQIRGTASPGPY